MHNSDYQKRMSKKPQVSSSHSGSGAKEASPTPSQVLPSSSHSSRGGAAQQDTPNPFLAPSQTPKPLTRSVAKAVITPMATSALRTLSSAHKPADGTLSSVSKTDAGAAVKAKGITVSPQARAALQTLEALPRQALFPIFSFTDIYY